MNNEVMWESCMVFSFLWVDGDHAAGRRYKSGLLAVIWVVPGDIAVKIARAELLDPAGQFTVVVTVPTDGTELEKVMVKLAAGYWSLDQYAPET
ncbi:hypothetical protein [Comamonas sp. JC664]|uniref:hypothetical protein n=1 Tax=Comamonas sp. JC664 TaxID=2801917 RepID=UPI003608CE6D